MNFREKKERDIGLIFDLDGVLVNTARYHFLAWQQIAESLGIVFNEKDNEKLKGVSRESSLEIILELGRIVAPEEQRKALCDRKNKIYLEYIDRLTPEEVLPGAREFVENARETGFKTAVGSASKNARLILEKIGLFSLFDVIIDGTRVSKVKPDPEIFLVGAKELNVLPQDCIVFEDSVAGVEAAHAAGMKAVGVGSKEQLPLAEKNIQNFTGLCVINVAKEIL